MSTSGCNALVTVCALHLAPQGAGESATSDQGFASILSSLLHLKTTTPRPQIVLLPFGCVSAAAGRLPAWPALDALAPLRAAARECGFCIAGGDEFAGQATAFIIDERGELILAQSSLRSGSDEASTHVVATRYGRLTCLPAGDGLLPEIARMAAFAGAEILLLPVAHPVDEFAAGRRCAHSARAWENLLAVVVADLSGAAQVWDFDGSALAEGSGGAVSATLDLASLRQRRGEPWNNGLGQLRTQLYASIYERAAAQSLTRPAATDGPAVEFYDVVMMQSHQIFIDGPGSREGALSQNMERALGQARQFCARPETRLLVLPELFLQGADSSALHEHWQSVCVSVPGPQTQRLAQFARDCDVYLCGAVLEIDADWPGRYFNTAFIISPQGDMVLRYRKLQCMELNGLMSVTTPGNVYSRYVERYGFESLIPVVDTPIGRLGAQICYDTNWPELTRALALRGAEVICLPTSEIQAGFMDSWTRAKRARAFENGVYIASANAASEQFSPTAPISGMNRGLSMLIDYRGRVVARTQGGGTAPLLGRVELGRMRRMRAAGLLPAAQGLNLASAASAYRAFPGFPLDCFARAPMHSPAEGPAMVRQQIAALQQAGVYVRC